MCCQVSQSRNERLHVENTQLDQTAAIPPIDLCGFCNMATTSQSLMSHMDRYLPSIELGVPHMFLGHRCQPLDCPAHPPVQQGASSILFLAFSSQIKYLLHVFILFVYKHCDRPSSETAATLLSLSSSVCFQTQTLSLHLHWR